MSTYEAEAQRLAQRTEVTAGEHAHQGHDSSHDHGHVVSVRLLSVVFGILLALTVLTYLVTTVNFGYTVNLLVALGIAFVKAALVCLYFMHLRWDNPFNAVALIASFGFVCLFIVAVCHDSSNYQRLLDPPGGYKIETPTAQGSVDPGDAPPSVDPTPAAVPH